MSNCCGYWVLIVAACAIYGTFTAWLYQSCRDAQQIEDDVDTYTTTTAEADHTAPANGNSKELL